jgi:hypothetical protein
MGIGVLILAMDTMVGYNLACLHGQQWGEAAILHRQVAMSKFSEARPGKPGVAGLPGVSVRTK